MYAGTFKERVVQTLDAVEELTAMARKRLELREESDAKLADTVVDELIPQARQLRESVQQLAPLIPESPLNLSSSCGSRCKEAGVLLWNVVTLAADTQTGSAGSETCTAPSPAPTLSLDARCALQELAAECFMTGQRMLAIRCGPLHTHPRTAVQAVLLCSRTGRDAARRGDFAGAERWFSRALSVVEHLAPRFLTEGPTTPEGSTCSIIAAKVRLAVTEVYVNVSHADALRGDYKSMLEHVTAGFGFFSGRFRRGLVRFVMDAMLCVERIPLSQQAAARGVLGLALRALDDDEQLSPRDARAFEPASAAMLKGSLRQLLAASFLEDSMLEDALREAELGHALHASSSGALMLLRCAVQRRDSAAATTSLNAVAHHAGGGRAADVAAAADAFVEAFGADHHRQCLAALRDALQRVRDPSERRVLRLAFARVALLFVSNPETAADLGDALAAAADDSAGDEGALSHARQLFASCRNTAMQLIVSSSTPSDFSPRDDRAVPTTCCDAPNATGIVLLQHALCLAPFAPAPEVCAVLRTLARQCIARGDPSAALRFALDARDMDGTSIPTALVLFHVRLAQADAVGASAVVDVLAWMEPAVAATEAIGAAVALASSCGNEPLMMEILQVYIDRVSAASMAAAGEPTEARAEAARLLLLIHFAFTKAASTLVEPAAPWDSCMRAAASCSCLVETAEKVLRRLATPATSADSAHTDSRMWVTAAQSAGVAVLECAHSPTARAGGASHVDVAAILRHALKLFRVATLLVDRERQQHHHHHNVQRDTCGAFEVASLHGLSLNVCLRLADEEVMTVEEANVEFDVRPLLADALAHAQKAKRLLVDVIRQQQRPCNDVEAVGTFDESVPDDLAELRTAVLFGEVECCCRLGCCTDAELRDMIAGALASAEGGCSPTGAEDHATELLRILLQQHCCTEPGSSHDAESLGEAEGRAGGVVLTHRDVRAGRLARGLGEFHASTMLLLQHLAAVHVKAISAASSECNELPRIEGLLRLVHAWAELATTMSEKRAAIGLLVRVAMCDAAAAVTPDEVCFAKHTRCLHDSCAPEAACARLRNALAVSDAAAVLAGQLAIECWNSAALEHNMGGEAPHVSHWLAPCTMILSLLPPHSLSRCAVMELWAPQVSAGR